SDIAAQAQMIAPAPGTSARMIACSPYAQPRRHAGGRQGEEVGDACSVRSGEAGHRTLAVAAGCWPDGPQPGRQRGAASSRALARLPQGTVGSGSPQLWTRPPGPPGPEVPDRRADPSRRSQAVSLCVHGPGPRCKPGKLSAFYLEGPPFCKGAAEA